MFMLSLAGILCKDAIDFDVDSYVGDGPAS